MKKFFKQFQKIQWRLTFTYMLATLLMLFLVELLVLVSNNRDSFSNPFFINATARSLSDSSSRLDGSLDTPYDEEAINLWITNNMRFLESNSRQDHPNDSQPPQDQPSLPQQADQQSGQQLDLPKLVNKDTQLFTTKPVAFSREKSRLVVASPEGVILGADEESEFPLGDNLLSYLDENEAVVVQEILSGSQTSVVFSNASTLYSSFAFPVMQNGEVKAVVFMRIVAPTLAEELDAALAGFLPDLPIFLITSVVVGFVFGSLLASTFTTRIQRLIEYTSRWGKGDFSKIEKIKEGDEIGELSTALNEMVDQFEELIESKKMLAVLEERNRFARDLHDSVKQEIFSISMNLGAIKSLIKTNPEKAGEQLEITAELAKQARSELSTLIYTLLPAQLENQDLDIALKEYVNVWEKNSGISVVYRMHGRKVEIPQEIEQTIFRITQEALSNIARHSKATATSVMLDFLPDFVRLQISDNGTGFDMNNVKKGLGLRSITERVAENQGKLDVDSSSGGTTITLQFPYQKIGAGEAHEEK